MRIVIAEDLLLLRDGLIRMLEDVGHTVVCAVENGPDLERAVAQHQPDISIIDVRLPPSFGDEGLKAALAIRSRVERAPVLILSQYVERTYAAELLADGKGAIGYLLKDRVTSLDGFLDALERVAGGGTAMDPEVVAQLFARNERNGPLAQLTGREREVLGLMAQGMTNAAIGARLFIARVSVEKHVGNILLKLDLPPAPDSHRRVRAVLAYLNG